MLFEQVKLPMLSPHEFTGQLWRTDEDRFHALMGTQHLRECWSHLLKTKPTWFTAHPAFRCIEQTGGAKHIPYRVLATTEAWGKFGASKILYWSLVLHHEGGVRLTRKCRISLFITDDGLCIKGCTEVPLITKTVWSFNQALHGVYSNRDEHGNELQQPRRQSSGFICGGHKFVFVQCCADRVYSREAFNLEWH